MAARLSLDTTFLIDLQREIGGSGPAHDFLGRHSRAELLVSVVVLGEFAEGFEETDHPMVTLMREQVVVLGIDEATALIYSAIARKLRVAGSLIGANDLWIASTSLRHGVPLVTANADHFGRVGELQVLTYR